MTVNVEPQRLCVKLGWYGRFLEGELTRRIKSKDSTWCLTGLDNQKQFEVLHVMMVGLRERGTKGGREGGREGGAGERERGREGDRQGGREGERERGTP